MEGYPSVHTEIHSPHGETQLDRATLIENRLRELSMRLKWMTILWWVLFVLVLLGAIGFGFMHLWDVRQLRKEGTDGWSQTTRRVDDMRKSSDEAIESRTTPLGQRDDLIWQQITQMQQQIGGLQARVDQCSIGCYPSGK